MFRSIIYAKPADLEAVVYLASNSVSPAYDGLELGVGDSLLVKAICEATGFCIHEYYVLLMHILIMGINFSIVVILFDWLVDFN